MQTNSLITFRNTCVTILISMNGARSQKKANNNVWQKCQIGPSFSWLTLTDVMGRLPKHLIVDTVQWNHNTDLHDGCQIKMNPAMVLPALNSCMGKPVRGERWCGHWLSLFVKILHPSPLATRLKLVICCLAACCQYAWESRFNICGLLTGMNAIRLFCGCKASLCVTPCNLSF